MKTFLIIYIFKFYSFIDKNNDCFQVGSKFDPVNFIYIFKSFCLEISRNIGPLSCKYSPGFINSLDLKPHPT